MIQRSINFAIVPARIGSKRIKRKNIKLFNGKPMFAWAYQIALKSKLFDKIIISSESNEVLKIAKKIGFDILIKRPNKLANDYVGTEKVIKHSIKELEKKYSFDNVCCIYPCNPFIQIKDLNESYKRLMSDRQKYIFPITNYSHPIERAYTFKNKTEIKFRNSFFKKKRTQDLQTKFYDTGQFYFASKKTWNKLQKTKKVGLKIPNWRVIDIDNKSDWKRAEIMYKFFKKNKILKLV